MKQHEFVVPLGAEQFYHETGRWNTSRSFLKVKCQLRLGKCSIFCVFWGLKCVEIQHYTLSAAKSHCRCMFASLILSYFQSVHVSFKGLV